MGGHTFRLCDLLPKEIGERGRHKQSIRFTLRGRSDEQVASLVNQLSSQLEPNQIIVVDGRIVARGSAVAADEEAAVPPEPEADDGQADEEDLTSEPSAAGGFAPADPIAATQFSIRMLWDAQRRHAAASEELCRRTAEMTDRAIAQMQKIDNLLSEVSSRRRETPAPPAEEPSRRVTLEDVAALVKMGAEVWRDVQAQGRGETNGR
jgi:hypothetical protein